MKSGEFQNLVRNHDEEYPILVKSSDHEYHEVKIKRTTGLYDETLGVWTEDFGEDYTPAAIYGERKNIFLIEHK